MRYPVLPTFLVLTALLGSCGPGQPTYLDRVQPLPAGRDHPLVQEVVPLLEKPEGRNPDDLMRTWKEFLGSTPQPLQNDKVVTFLYYDFTRSLDQVFLEASFAPDRKEPLVRVGTTSLFTRSYVVPRLDRVQYRYSDGNKPLVDPFFADVAPGGELWHGPSGPTEATIQWIAGVSEPVLAGQDLVVLLPPNYRRNLAAAYPLLVVVGTGGDGWTDILTRMMKDEAIRPLIAVSVATKEPWTVSGLKSVLEAKVVPWVRSRYRVSPLAADLVLAGWGSSAKTVLEVAATRTDFWNKAWAPPADQVQGDQAWNLLAPPYVRAQFGTAKP